MIYRTESGGSPPADELPSEADVLVAGSGAAGLTAALAAASAGARVLLVERGDRLGGTTAVSGGRVWVPCNHCPENSADTPGAAREYLRALVPARHAGMIEVFVESAPAMARFVESASPHRFAACPHYPDYHPWLPGATLGGRCLDMHPADLRQRTPLASLIRVPPGCGSSPAPGSAPSASTPTELLAARRWPFPAAPGRSACPR
jgi:3-oxosteroid 1-dehydrogenase